MNKRIPKISPPSPKTMASPVRSAPVAAPKPKPASSSARPSTGSGRTKGRAGGRALSSPEFNAAAIKRSLVVLFPFSVFLFFGLILIWERVKVRELATAISQLETQRNQLADQNVKLKNEVEQLSGYGRISRLASQRLGLVAVPQQAIIVADE